MYIIMLNIGVVDEDCCGVEDGGDNYDKNAFIMKQLTKN